MTDSGQVVIHAVKVRICHRLPTSTKLRISHLVKDKPRKQFKMEKCTTD